MHPGQFYGCVKDFNFRSFGHNRTTPLLITKFVFMKKVAFLVLFLLLVLSNSLISQERKTSKYLPLLVISNSKFLPVLDKVIASSKDCEKSGLKFLTFYIKISLKDSSTAYVYMTLVDCQGLNYILKQTYQRDAAVGYFKYHEQTFIVTGQIDSFNLLNKTISKKEFNFTNTGYLLKAEYSNWSYQYTADNGFRLIMFHPLCDSKKVYPICIDLKKK